MDVSLRRRLLPLVACVLLAGLSPSAPVAATDLSDRRLSASPAAEELIRAGLHDLHDGLYDSATERFRAAGRAAPHDPAPPLFRAFVSWWRMLQDRTDRSWDDEFFAASDEAIQGAAQVLEAAPGDVRALTIVGTAHILRSLVEGMRRSVFRAGQEVRRGKKSLEGALAADPGNKDALFGLGAFNYFTDKIPGLARGLLFIPHGDPALGLLQLKSVAESDAHFRTEARLLLAIICGGRDERCYDDAQAQLGIALSENPRSPLLLGSLGGVRMRLGLYTEAVKAYEEALADATGEAPERVQQRRLLTVYLAEAQAADWGLDRARATLDRAGDPTTLPGRERQVVDRVRRELSEKSGAADNGAAPPRGLAGQLTAALAAEQQGNATRALALLAKAAADFPSSPLPRFLSGRLLLEGRRYDEAERELAAAQERAPEPPAWLLGWIEVDRGLAQRGLGHPVAARAHFQAASEVRKFRSAERGLLELQEGKPPHGRCRP